MSYYGNTYGSYNAYGQSPYGAPQQPQQPYGYAPPPQPPQHHMPPQQQPPTYASPVYNYPVDYNQPPTPTHTASPYPSSSVTPGPVPTELKLSEIRDLPPHELRSQLTVMVTAQQNRLHYKYHLRLIDDLMILLSETKRYSVTINHHATIDGVPSQTVLRLTGLLPMEFRGTVYKTPIRIDMPLNYPDRAPIVHVVEENGLMISPRCTFLDQHSGEVYHEAFLAPRWQTSSTIGNALTTLSQAFGQFPPLYTPSADQLAQRRAAEKIAEKQQKSEREEYERQERFAQKQRDEDLARAQQESALAEKERLMKQQRRDMEDFLSIKCSTQLKQQYKTLSEQLAKMNDDKRQLSTALYDNQQRGASSGESLGYLRELRAAQCDDLFVLEQIFAELSNIESVLSSDSSVNANNLMITMRNIDDFDLDAFEEQFLENNLFITIKTQSTKQLIHEDSVDSSIDDVITSLDGLLNEGKCGDSTGEVYLKHLRLLSRRQYMARCLTKKILSSAASPTQ